MSKPFFKKAPSDDQDGALAYALKLLAKREYSKRELFGKLTLKYDRKAALDAVAKCVRNNYQSDDRCADMLYRHCVFMHQGPRKLYALLAAKGLDSKLVCNLVNKTDWVGLACELLEKKAALAVEDKREKRKLLSLLLRRGFSVSCGIEALKRLESAADDDINGFFDRQV